MFSKKQSFITLALLCMVSSAPYAYSDTALAPTEITQDSFEKEVLGSQLPVLLDVYAVWCGPCQMLKPIFAQVARDFKDSCKMVTMDFEKNSDVATKFEIKAFPTLLIFHKGAMVQKIEGCPPSKEELARVVQAIVDYAAKN